VSTVNQELRDKTGANGGLFEEFAQLARLALSGQGEDARLYVARVARKLRATRPEVATRLEELLKARPTRSASVMRRTSLTEDPAVELPIDQESRQSLLKVFTSADPWVSPLLAPEVEAQLSQIVRERRHADRSRRACNPRARRSSSARRASERLSRHAGSRPSSTFRSTCWTSPPS
jgi:hypothetical protein